MQEWGGGTGELCACVLVLQFSTSLLHTSAEAGFKRLEVKIPAQDFFNCSFSLTKSFYLFKAPPCPLWPHLAICCTCNGFSLIWPKWSCWNPVWDLISTVNLRTPACEACQMLWVVSYLVHYSHFQEEKWKCFFFKKEKIRMLTQRVFAPRDTCSQEGCYTALFTVCDVRGSLFSGKLYYFCAQAKLSDE